MTSNIQKPRKAVYFFCADPAKDPVAHSCFEASKRLCKLVDAGFEVDGHPVLMLEDSAGNSLYYVRINDVLSHDYAKYLPILNERFSNFDFAGLVNWHEGKNAPDAILTVHTTGDVVSGHFGASAPALTRSLMLAIEENRKLAGLEGFTTISEATHWSGVVYGGSPELIPRFPVPLVDIEIGSSPASWTNQAAIDVVARSLPVVFEAAGAEANLRVLLCFGGVHLEASFAQAVLNTKDEYALAAAHILPNHWIVEGGYDSPDGLEKLDACVKSVKGGIHAIAFHDNLKGAYKAQLRAFAERLAVPIFKHQALRQPQSLPIW